MTKPKPWPRIETARVPNFHAIQQAAFAAISGLPRKPECTGLLFESMAERYAYLAFEYLEERYTEPLTLSDFRLHMQAIQTSAAALLDVLRTLRGPAIDALNKLGPSSVAINRRTPRLPTLFEFQEHLAWLAESASRAQPTADIKDGRGPAPMKTLRKIADRAADDFFEITGKTPSRSRNRGSFGEFLKTLFGALRIAESANSFKQEAVENWKEGRSPLGERRSAISVKE